MTKIVVIAFGIPVDTGGGPHFGDVPESNPFYPYIETAYNSQLVSGYSDGTFRWGSDVTRGQLSKITVSAARLACIDPALASFSDVARGSTFYSYVETAYCVMALSVVLDDMFTFRPGNNATRAQISKIVSLAVQGWRVTPCNPAAGSTGEK